MNDRRGTFIAGSAGDWEFDRVTPIRGDALPSAPRLAHLEGVPAGTAGPTVWSLEGVRSNERYTTAEEK